jgi:hypothetical protein
MNARTRIGLAEHLLVQEIFDGIDAAREADWWWRHSDFVLEGGGTAVYIEANNDNRVVIRQRCASGDAFVIIPPDQLQVLIDRLRDLFGGD